MSRIDGVLSIEELAFSCGISNEEIEHILERLIELGAAQWGDNHRSANDSERLEADVGELQVKEQPSEIASKTQAFQKASPEFKFTAELDRDIELSIERQQEILEAFHRMDKQNHYQALGVSQDADKQEIRTAYFELSKRYHTDSVFGKRLGQFKGKMEAVFKQITQAYEVLGKKKKRRDYDEYLAATAQTQEVVQILASARGQTRSFSDDLAPTFAEQSTVEGTTERSSAVDMKTPVQRVRPESSSRDNERPRISSKPSLTLEERRSLKERVLRMRLSTVGGASSIPPSQLSVSSIPASKSEDSKIRRDSLIRSLASSLDATSKITGGRDKTARYLKEAQAAERKGDLVEAANQLRLAVFLGPDREDIKAEYERVRSSVASYFADKFEKQAIYEEKEGKWKAAAQSWSRVCDGRPTDAFCAMRAAEAFLKASGDMRKAYKFAQKAVDIEPDNLSHLLLLIRIYLALGHKLNAKRELERAAKLDPKNKTVKDLLREVR